MDTDLLGYSMLAQASAVTYVVPHALLFWLVPWFYFSSDQIAHYH